MDTQNTQAITFEQGSVKREFPADIEFIQKKEVLKLFGVSRSSFDLWQNPKSEYYRPQFPKKIVIDGYVLYVRSEIKAYMQSLMDSR